MVRSTGAVRGHHGSGAAAIKLNGVRDTPSHATQRELTMVMSGYSSLVPRVAGWWSVRNDMSTRMSSSRCSGNCHTRESCANV